MQRVRLIGKLRQYLAAQIARRVQIAGLMMLYRFDKYVLQGWVPAGLLGVIGAGERRRTLSENWDAFGLPLNDTRGD